MKTGVIVSTYNRPNALKKVLDGLLGQTRIPDEVIIADDGSDDETRQAVQPYLDKHGEIFRHVWHEDKGFRAARVRNLAIKSSSSDYLIFLDGDCIPGKHYVLDHWQLAREGFFFQGKRIIISQAVSAGFVFSDTLSVFKQLKLALTGGLSNAHHIIRIPILPAFTTSKLSGIRSCNMGIFKKDLIAVNGFNEAFKGWGREDSELVVRMYKYGIKRNEHPFRAVCYHLWHPENDRGNLEKNDALLEAAIRSESYYCSAGIKENE